MVDELFALLSLPYVYPYGYIVAPIMILALSVSVALFVAFPRARKYVPPVVAIIGFVDIQAFPRFADGVGLGFLTLTCAGMMATVYFKKILILKIVTALAFVAFGGFLISQTVDVLSKMSLSIMSNLTSWIVLLSWASTTFSGGLLIMILALKNRFGKSNNGET